MDATRMIETIEMTVHRLNAELSSSTPDEEIKEICFSALVAWQQQGTITFTYDEGLQLVTVTFSLLNQG